MWNYREFLMQGFRSAVGKMADYQVIFNANGYYEKGVLLVEDLAELQTMIDEKNTPIAQEIIFNEDEVVEEPIEPSTEIVEDTVEEATEETESIESEVE